jgi:hypothetical protein
MLRKVGGMKFSNRAVSLMVIVAALLAVGGVGLLIRRARTGNSQAGPQAVAGVDDASSQSPRLPDGLDGRRTVGTPEERAKLKEQRAEILRKMESLTEEEKEQFRARVSARYSSRQAGRRGFQNLSPQEREALRKQMEERVRAVRRQRESATQSGQEEGTDAGHSVETIDSEPNQPNQS